MSTFKSVYQITQHLAVAIDFTNSVVAVIDDEIISSCRHALLVTTGEAQDKIQQAETTDAAVDAVADDSGEAPSIPISDEWTVENELMVHASNLEAWVENDYDPRLVHSNIARPLLEKLAKIDEKARNRFLAILEELVGKGTKTLISWAVEKYGDFLLDLLDSNIVLAAILNNIDLLFANDVLLRTKYGCYVNKHDFMRVTMIKRHGNQLESIWDGLNCDIKKQLVFVMSLDQIKAMFLTKPFHEIDIVDLIAIHIKINSIMKGLCHDKDRSKIMECQGYLKSIKAFLSSRIMQLDRLSRYNLALKFGAGVVENLCEQDIDAFYLWEFAFKVVNAKDPGHINKNSVFRVISSDALQRIKFKLGKSTVQDKYEFGPFSAFTDVDQALNFMKYEHGNCVLLCLVKRTSSRTLWKKNPPDFTRNRYGGGYHAVSCGRSENHFDRLPKSFVFCSRVIPIRIVAFRSYEGEIGFHGYSKKKINKSEVENNK